MQLTNNWANNSTWDRYSSKARRLAFNSCMNRWQTDVQNPSLNSWNQCLGLTNKKDYVTEIIKRNEIEVCCMQETEVKVDYNNFTLVFSNLLSQRSVKVVTTLLLELSFVLVRLTTLSLTKSLCAR